MTDMSTHLGMSRRQALKAGAAGVVATASLAGSACASTTNGLARSGGRSRPNIAKNVIFLAVDGMAQGTWTMADMASRSRGGGRSAWAELYENGAPMTQCLTHSANSQVTDSAAASCAWGTGVHIDNGSINIHEGRELEPMLVTAKKAGKATALVTTTTVTHATPAGFVANVPNRRMEKEIGQQMLARGVDIVLGGGARYFDMNRLRQTPGLALATGTDSLRERAGNFRIGSERLMGLFTVGHMNYELDRPASEPRLREMSMLAIERLAEAPEGFVLQIESGRVDHAGHGNDAPGNLFDQLEFDDTLRAVTEWAGRRDDTLVIITTDHGCASPDLTLYLEGGNDGFDRLLGARRTMSACVRSAGEGGSAAARAERVAQEIRSGMSVELTASQIAWLAGVYSGERADGFSAANSESGALGALLANHFGVGFVSGNHTSEMVHATATGPGTERMKPLMDNIDLYGVAMNSMAIA
ncbi:MAG: alkaline phosphatase [Planctomycetota bacterium]